MVLLPLVIDQGVAGAREPSLVVCQPQDVIPGVILRPIGRWLAQDLE